MIVNKKRTCQIVDFAILADFYFAGYAGVKNSQRAKKKR